MIAGVADSLDSMVADTNARFTVGTTSACRVPADRHDHVQAGDITIRASC